MRFYALLFAFSLSLVVLSAYAETSAMEPVAPVAASSIETPAAQAIQAIAPEAASANTAASETTTQAPAQATEAVPVQPARVNGVMIEAALVQAYIAENPDNAMLQNPEFAMQNVVLLELLNQEAVKQGLLDDMALQAKIKVQAMTTIADALLNAFMVQNPLTEADIEAVYQNQVVAQMQKEYRASHILVDNEELAKELHARLVKGEDFAALASAFSQDPGSAPNGGDLGFFTESDMVPEFSAAVAAATLNEVTPVVKSDFGYHVIIVTDSRQQTPPALSEIRPQIEQLLQRQALQNYVNDLVNAADIFMP